MAIEYVRAVNSGDPDTAVNLLDMDELVRRVEEKIVVVQHDDAEKFLRDSVETILWGLFRQTKEVDYAYDAAPAELHGDAANVTVSKVDAEGREGETAVSLKKTDRGWRVSGDSLDPLVSYAIERLEERY
ncbi:MAG: nuclear transport factor 2 family protein [Acidobacteriota bacterium]